ncbi:MAG: hypothetical protein J6T56_08670, partial [Bacteroidales bacterium]|nr:hypothetical protein [Bacteroidales bacterium]
KTPERFFYHVVDREIYKTCILLILTMGIIGFHHLKQRGAVLDGICIQPIKNALDYQVMLLNVTVVPFV